MAGRKKIILVLTLCFMQVAVSAWGVFSCVCEDGPVSGWMMEPSLDADEDTCASEKDVGLCFCCAGEDNSHDCMVTIVSTFLPSSRSAIQETTTCRSGGTVSVAGVNGNDTYAVVKPSGNVRNFLHIESTTRLSTSSVVLLI